MNIQCWHVTIVGASTLIALAIFLRFWASNDFAEHARMLRLLDDELLSGEAKEFAESMGGCEAYADAQEISAASCRAWSIGLALCGLLCLIATPATIQSEPPAAKYKPQQSNQGYPYPIYHPGGSRW